MKEQQNASGQPSGEVAFIRIARVKEISGLSKSTLWRWIRSGHFPAPVVARGNSVLWDLAEILKWRAEQFRERERRLQAENEERRAS